jgi:heme/copper-type cytochrome/quinol oxidase subunit 1
MEISLNKPYLISWLAIPILVLIGLLFRQHTLDIQLYDTYFVVANLHFALAGSALLLIIGMGYWLVGLSGKTPNLVLTLVHLSLTIGVLVIVALPLFNTDSLASTEWLFLMIVAFLLAQCAYTINILITLLRK